MVAICSLPYKLFLFLPCDIVLLHMSYMQLHVYLSFIFKKLTLASGSFNSMNVTQMAKQAEDLELQEVVVEDSRPSFSMCYVCGTY